MCRNIRTLFNFEPVATDEEIEAAALQFVRKVSGFTKPSQANEAAFNDAIEAVAAITRDLVRDLVTNAPPKDREEEAAKARARASKRYAKMALGHDSESCLARRPARSPHRNILGLSSFGRPPHLQ